MNYWGIQKRLLLIILLPCLISALLLGGYSGYQNHIQLNKQDAQQAILLSRQLALHTASFIQQDQDSIRSALQSYLNLPKLRALALLDSRQDQRLQIGPNMLPTTSKRYIEANVHRFDTASSIRVRAPIYAQTDKVQAKLLGWIELEFDTSVTQVAQYQAILSSLLFILVLVMFGFYLAYRASIRITAPLQHVATALEQLESGNLEARIQLPEQTEFKELANGINSMATSLQSAQQELQDNIEQATEDLKETLEEMEVQNIELNLARRSALESSNIKSEFLANMSHEIRTPLNGILGFSKLLEKTHLNKRQMEYLNTIETSSSSLLSIINDILDFSKIEAGKLVLDRVPINIRDITDEVLTILAPEAHKKELELAALVYQDVPAEVMGDSVRIKQVLTNLISNAVKFTESGSVIVRIMLEEQIKQKVSLKVTITDTGIGLTGEQQKNLFKAFSQADASTTRRYGGTGLGLVISSYLVEHMQGEIGFSSQSGSGSQFWFTGQFELCNSEMDSWDNAPWYQKTAYVHCQWDHSLQALQHQLSNLGFKVKGFKHLDKLIQMQQKQAAELCLVEVDEQTDSKSLTFIKQQSKIVALLPNNESHHFQVLQRHKIEHNLVHPVSFRRLNQMVHDILGETIQDSLDSTPLAQLKVLAVDDNPPNLELLSTWLVDLNIQVVQARGGLEAVKLGCNQKFDLIFMDIQMPDLDGVLATQEIRQYPLNQQTPLVALTAHALANERKQLMQNGFDDYLSKPLSEDQLIHTLTKWTHFQRPGKINYAKKASMLVEPVQSATSNSMNATLVVDWQSCLTLAGGKPKLAKAMLLGLIDELQLLLPRLNTESTDNLLEPVHKAHGLCHYVGAQKLKLALGQSETCLKTNIDNWPEHQEKLSIAIQELLSWHNDSQWLEQLDELELD